MNVAFFDRTEYDDLSAYRQFADVRVFTRWTAKQSADWADVTFTTYTRPPDTSGIVVNMASSDRRHLSHLTRARVIQCPEWNVHAVAKWTLDRVPPSTRCVAVVGMGQIGRLVSRYLVYRGVRVVHVPHTARRMPPVDVATIHVPLTTDTRGWFGRGFFVNQRGCVLINSARRAIVPDSDLQTAIRNGQVSTAHLDGGAAFDSPHVIVTPHEAWKSSRSKLKRPFRVLAMLRRLAADLCR